MELRLKARLTSYAHLFKACTRQHHRELVPFLSRLIARDGVVLDVGSHAGQFAKLFARLAPDGRVYAFEPGAYARSILRRSIRFNRLRNVTILPYGLGDAPGRVALSVPVKPSGSIGFGLSHVRTADAARQRPRPGWSHVEETIRLDTMDRFVAAAGLERVDFVKADIEGWELRMLAGAEGVIARFRPTLMLEVVDAHLARAGDGAEALFRHLRGKGYRALAIDPAQGRFVELARARDGDIVFAPERAAAALLELARIR